MTPADGARPDRHGRQLLDAGLDLGSLLAGNWRRRAIGSGAAGQRRDDRPRRGRARLPAAAQRPAAALYGESPTATLRSGAGLLRLDDVVETYRT